MIIDETNDGSCTKYPYEGYATYADCVDAEVRGIINGPGIWFKVIPCQVSSKKNQFHSLRKQRVIESFRTPTLMAVDIQHNLLILLKT